MLNNSTIAYMNKVVCILTVLVCLAFAACKDANEIPNGYIETTEEGSVTLVMKGYEGAATGFSVFQPQGFDKPFYIKDKGFAGAAYRFQEVGPKGLSEMVDVPESGEWLETVAIREGAAYWACYSSFEAYKYVKLRVAYIDGNDVGLEYVLARTDKRPNANANVKGEKVSVTALEIPHLLETNTYVDHYVKVNGKDVLNMALEWNAAKKHAQWVAFAFNEVTSWDRQVGRNEKWLPDAALPTDMQVVENDHKKDGFDKGHLCASEDRQYSKEANEQTFLFSNMSPQLNKFNGGFWMKLEALVQSWGYSVSTGGFHHVYVTKGGTLNELAANLSGDGYSTDAKGYTVKGLACPKYYYMAVLAEKNGEYQSIAFLVPHDGSLTTKPTADDFKRYVVTISQLEERTQTDFFCNLPDDIEQAVESVADVNLWAW